MLLAVYFVTIMLFTGLLGWLRKQGESARSGFHLFLGLAGSKSPAMNDQSIEPLWVGRVDLCFRLSILLGGISTVVSLIALFSWPWWVGAILLLLVSPLALIIMFSLDDGPALRRRFYRGEIDLPDTIRLRSSHAIFLAFEEIDRNSVVDSRDDDSGAFDRFLIVDENDGVDVQLEITLESSGISISPADSQVRRVPKQLQYTWNLGFPNPGEQTLTWRTAILVAGIRTECEPFHTKLKVQRLVLSELTFRILTGLGAVGAFGSFILLVLEATGVF